MQVNLRKIPGENNVGGGEDKPTVRLSPTVGGCDSVGTGGGGAGIREAGLYTSSFWS